MKSYLLTSLLLLVSLLVAASAEAQVTYPLALRLAWDPNPVEENVTQYIVTIRTNTITYPASQCQPTICIHPFTVLTAGPHPISVSAVNAMGVSAPSGISYTVPPTLPPPNNPSSPRNPRVITSVMKGLLPWL